MAADEGIKWVLRGSGAGQAEGAGCSGRSNVPLEFPPSVIRDGLAVVLLPLGP